MNKLAKNIANFLILAVLFTVTFNQFLLAETYKYIDKNGVVVFTDDKESIPPEFRKNVVVIKDEQPESKIPDTKTENKTPHLTKSQEHVRQAEQKSLFSVYLKKLTLGEMYTPLLAAVLIIVFVFAGYLLRGLNNSRIVTIIRGGIILILLVLVAQKYLEKVQKHYEDLKGDVDALQKKAIKREIKIDDVSK